MSEQPISPEEPVVPEPANFSSEEPVAPQQEPARWGDFFTPKPSPQVAKVPDPERKRKRRDIWIGFGGSWIGTFLAYNIFRIIFPPLLNFLSKSYPTNTTIADFPIYFCGLWGLGMLAVLIFVGRKRSTIALGMVLAVASAFFLYILLSVVYLVGECFTSLS